MDRKVLTIILIGIIFAIIGLWIYTAKNPNQSSNSNNQNNLADVNKIYGDLSFGDLRKFDIDGPKYKIELPNKDLKLDAKVYEYQKAKLDDNKINQINNKLGLDITDTINQSEVGKFIMSGKDNANISFYPDQGWLIYVNEESIDTIQINQANFTKDDNLDDFKKLAEEQFLSQIGSIILTSESESEPTLAKYTYAGSTYRKYPNPHYQKVATKDQAGLIEFKYEELIDGITVEDKSHTLLKNSISIFIAKDKNLKRVEIKMAGKLSKDLGTVPLKNYQELTEAVKNGQASIVKSDFGADDQINEATINEAKLIYIIKDNKLIPAYELFGSIQSKQGISSEAVFLISALK